jgi:peptidylprolyl isomerase
MATAKNGDRVLFNYVGKLEDGTIFDSTFESDCSDDGCSSDDCGCGHETGPMELVIGSGEFFPAIEAALAEMAQGEKKSIVIPAAEAFGEFDAERLFTVDLSDMPADFAPQIGDELVLTGDDDEELGVTVIEMTEKEVTFDANHPLAGQALTFDLELLEIL